MKDELTMEIDPQFNENHATADDWRKALHKVVPAVVVLRMTASRAFDTKSAGASYATGFVVYKSRGIILTNRNVVKPGSCQDKWEAVTIPRGTLQATFVHKGFDETRRLGLQTETEQLVRHVSPLSETGMLVVDSVVPGGICLCKDRPLEWETLSAHT